MSKTIFCFSLREDEVFRSSFAVGATVRANGVEVGNFAGRIPGVAISDSWITANMSRALVEMKITHDTSESLEEAFWSFYDERCLIEGEYGRVFDADNVCVIAHSDSCYGSDFFRRAVRRDRSRMFQVPYPIQEVGTLLEMLGEDTRSVHSYVERHEIITKGVDDRAKIVALVWEHASARIRGEVS